MEYCIPNSLWIIRVSGHALRPYKRPCILPTFYEQSFQGYFLCVCVVVVYLHDIMIYSDNPDEHLRHVREVLRRRFRANPLYAKVEECAFSMNTTDFLGSILALTAFKWTPRRFKSSATHLNLSNG